MHTKKQVLQAGFNVIGIAARTSNAVELNGNGIIPALWQRFFVEKAQEKIPHKIDGRIIALYCDYAGNKDDEYTIIVGAWVDSIDQIPAGMVAHHVPAQQCDVFTIQSEDGTAGIVAAWKYIWDLENKGVIDRIYNVDYELYGQDAAAEIYIGVR